MGELKTAINNVTVFLDNAWTIMVRAAEIVAGIKLFGVQYMETAIGTLPIAQILGAILITDVTVFVYSLLRSQSEKKR